MPSGWWMRIRICTQCGYRHRSLLFLIPLLGVPLVFSLDILHVEVEYHGWLNALAVWLLISAVSVGLVFFVAFYGKRKEA